MSFLAESLLCIVRYADLHTQGFLERLQIYFWIKEITQDFSRKALIIYALKHFQFTLICITIWKLEYIRSVIIFYNFESTLPVEVKVEVIKNLTRASFSNTLVDNKPFT
jgi:hypothetical protein